MLPVWRLRTCKLCTSVSLLSADSNSHCKIFRLSQHCWWWFRCCDIWHSQSREAQFMYCLYPKDGCSISP